VVAAGDAATFEVTSATDPGQTARDKHGTFSDGQRIRFERASTR
jgi:hypothetical protein